MTTKELLRDGLINMNLFLRTCESLMSSLSHLASNSAIFKQTNYFNLIWIWKF